jgi:hypothetical protein
MGLVPDGPDLSASAHCSCAGVARQCMGLISLAPTWTQPTGNAATVQCTVSAFAMRPEPQPKRSFENSAPHLHSSCERYI